MDRWRIGAWLLPVLLAAGPEQGVHLGNGIRIGEVTGTGARIWVRLTSRAEANSSGTPFPDAKLREPQLPRGRVLAEMEGAMPGAAGQLRLTWHAVGVSETASGNWVDVDEKTDFAHIFALDRLEPATDYALRIEARGDASENTSCRLDTRLRTAAAATDPEPVSFCVVTGQDYHRRDAGDRGHAIYAHMLALEPDFLVHTGDTVYYDKPRPFAGSVELARFKWNRMYALPLQRAFHCRIPAYFIKDDHDILKDDCWPGQSYGEIDWERGLALFREQLPVGDLPFRTIRRGRDLQLWLVEGREFRSDNREPDGPDKTIWGEAQKRWLRETLSASDATFRIVISATPVVGPDRPTKNDNHANAGFRHEGARMREFLAGQEGVIVICGDRHWQYVSSDPVTGLTEFSCGPTSDAHAGGFRDADRSPMHSYLNIVGGFLHVAVEQEGDRPRLVLRHHGADGRSLNEIVREGRR